ncbi:TPA: LPXTG cell wall anchor domain-containing protein, partial [Streptococcus suis]
TTDTANTSAAETGTTDTANTSTSEADATVGEAVTEEIITAKGESVKAPALPTLDLSAIKASHAPAVAAASAKKETLPNTGVSESLALTALGLLGLAVAGKLAQRKKY